MPIFRYKGYKSDGTDIKGVIEASGTNDAIVRVREEGIFPSEITEGGVKSRIGIFRRPDETFLPAVTRQLSILLSSGVPLMEALQSLSDENRGFYKGILIKIKEQVAGGASLSRALENFSTIFPEFYINMIHSGEEIGTLDKMLMRLADFLESQHRIKAKVRSAMIYPVLMMGVSIVVLSFLFTFVVPKIVKIFNDTKTTLPFATNVLIFISNIFVNYWWLLTALAIGAIAAVRRYFRKYRLFIDRLLLKLPGDVIQSLFYARFARTLGFLLEGGIPMVRALKLSAKSTGNKVLEASVLSAEGRIIEGQRLSSSLEDFPPVFIQLISTGEKSGRLSETLNRAADAYENEFDNRINRAVSVVEPLMILIMGLVIGFIVLAVLLPLFQLNQLIK